MKVIKKNDYSDWTYKCSCPQCTSELEVEKDDIVAKYHDGDFRDPAYHSYEVNCPVCKCNFTIPEKSIPDYLKKIAKSKCPKGSGNYFDR